MFCTQTVLDFSVTPVVMKWVLLGRQLGHNILPTFPLSCSRQSEARQKGLCICSLSKWVKVYTYGKGNAGLIHQGPSYS